MIELKINNSVCSIQGLDRPNFDKLRELMHYTVNDNYFTRKVYYSKKYLLDRRGFFPTGLLYLVKKYLSENKIQYTTTDTRLAPTPNSRLLALGSTFKQGLHLLPYDVQVDAVDAAKRFKRGIIAAPTGVGKSLIIAMLFNEFKVKTQIVVPSVELKTQLADTFNRMFDPKIVKDFIKIDNVQSLDTFKLSDAHMLIIDEAHHVAASTYRTLNKLAWSKIYHRFFLTATPFRSNSEERLLFESIAGEIIHKVEYTAAVEKGYIVPIEAYYIEVPPQPFKSNSWREVYTKLVVDNKVRNEIIKELLLKFHANNLSTLCLVKEISHGQLLAGNNFLFAAGINDDNKDLISKFNSGEIKTLIGTTGVIGEGIDTKPAEYIIIAGLGKSKNAFMQQCGRGFRKYPGKESCKVILFMDKSHKFTLRHFKEQCKFLKEEYGIIPVKLEI